MQEEDGAAFDADAGDGVYRQAIVDSAMKCFGAQGFAATSLDDVARAARLSPTELRSAFARKGDIMRAFSEAVDRQVLSAPIGTAEPALRRIGAVLWRRLEVLAPYREGLAHAVRDIPGDRVLSVSVTLRIFRSVRKMLEHVGIATDGASGSLRVRAVSYLYGEVLVAWVGDRTADWRETAGILEAGLPSLGNMAQGLSGPR